MAYPLANQQKTDGKITILNRKIAIFNSYVSHYQWDTIWKMVVLWENPRKIVGWLGMAYHLANQPKNGLENHNFEWENCHVQ